jgi:hypothetical protein
MTEINIGLLEEVLLWATDEYEKECNGEPSEWAQGTWYRRNSATSCGTVCCIAGKAAQLSEKYSVRFNSFGDAGLFDEHSNIQNFSDVGAAELGLQRDVTYDLFVGNNLLSDLWRCAYRVTDGKLDIPHDRAWLAVNSVHGRALEENAVRKNCECRSCVAARV